MDGRAHLIRRPGRSRPCRARLAAPPRAAAGVLAVATALVAALAAGAPSAGAVSLSRGTGPHRHLPEALRPVVLPLPDGASEPHLVRLAENGDVLGQALVDGAAHAVVWRGGSPTDLGAATPIDLEAGRAVADDEHGILFWADLDGSPMTLPLPPGAVRAHAVDLAGSGTVAGLTQDADGRQSAVVWPDGGPAVTVVGVAAGGAVRIARVTDDGAVYGDAQEPGGVSRVWRWDAAGGVRYVPRNPAHPERGFLQGPLAAVSAQGRWLVTGAGGETVATVWSQAKGVRAVISAESMGVETAGATAVNDQGLVGGWMLEGTILAERGWRWDHRFGHVGEYYSGPVGDMNVLGDVVCAGIYPSNLRVTHGPAVRELDQGGEDKAFASPQINDAGQIAVDVHVLDDYSPLRTELVMWS